MARSGDFILANTAHDIVSAALLKCQAIDPDQPLETTDLNTGLNELNRLVKYYQSKGAQLWKLTEGVLFLDTGKTSYLLGPTGDEWCDSGDFVSTTLDAAEASGQTVLSVTATTGFANSDKIGVELDDGTRHWTTIQSFVAGDTVTVDSALPSAAASGNTVYVYTTPPPRPLALFDCRYQTTQSDNEIPIHLFSRQEYLKQTDKTSQGSVVQAHYQPLLDNGKVYVWQPTNSVKSVMRFSYQRPIEIFTGSSNNPDFPAEWYLALAFNLAKVLAPEYKTPADVRAENKDLAAEYLADAMGFDNEMGAIQVCPQ